MVVEHNPWFPEEGSFNLEIWKQVKEKICSSSHYSDFDEKTVKWNAF